MNSHWQTCASVWFDMWRVTGWHIQMPLVTHASNLFVQSSPEMRQKRKKKRRRFHTLRTQFCHSVAISILCIWISYPIRNNWRRRLQLGKTVEQRTSISLGRWLCCAFSSEQVYSTKFLSHLNYMRNLPDSNIYRCLHPTLDCILFSNWTLCRLQNFTLANVCIPQNFPK